MGDVISLATGQPIRGKSLVVAPEATRYSLRMSPALTDQERAVVAYYDEPRQALASAASLSRMFPSLYRTVIDQTWGAA